MLLGQGLSLRGRGSRTEKGLERCLDTLSCPPSQSLATRDTTL